MRTGRRPIHPRTHATPTTRPATPTPKNTEYPNTVIQHPARRSQPIAWWRVERRMVRTAHPTRRLRCWAGCRVRRAHRPIFDSPPHPRHTHHPTGNPHTKKNIENPNTVIQHPARRSQPIAWWCVERRMVRTAHPTWWLRWWVGCTVWLAPGLHISSPAPV